MSGAQGAQGQRPDQGFSITDNLTLPNLARPCRWGLVDAAKAFHLAQDQGRAMDLRAAGMGLATRNLSGGTQQKLVIGKRLACAPPR